MRLICENTINNDELELVMEDSYQNGKHQKTMKIRGIYIVSEAENANERVYSRKHMQTAVDEYYNEYIKAARAVGELNHPDSIDIDYERACHLITDLKQDGNVWIGESKVLTTPMGTLLTSLLEDGVKVGVSTRGVGEVDSQNRVTDYKLITVDVVSNPSAGSHGAFVKGIYESKQYMIDTHGDIIEQAFSKLDENLATLPLRSVERDNHITNAIKNFISATKY